MSVAVVVVLVTVAVLCAGAAVRPSVHRVPVAARRATAPVAHRRRGVAVAMTAIPALFLAAGPLMALLGVTAVVMARWWRLRQGRLAQRRAIDAAYPDAIDLVVVGIRAGLLPLAALRNASDHVPDALRPAFDDVVARSTAGERFADALDGLPASLGEIARPMVDSFAAADRYGLPLAPVLERLADEARAHRRRTADAAARQLPVRLAAPLVVCTLPSFVLLAIVPLLIGAFSSWQGP